MQHIFWVKQTTIRLAASAGELNSTVFYFLLTPYNTRLQQQ